MPCECLAREEVDTEDELEAGLMAGLDAETEALVEHLARAAETARSDAEACGLASGIATCMLMPAPVYVRRLAPVLIRRTIYLVRVLRRTPARRRLIRTVPLILRRTAGTLVRKAKKRRPVTAKTAVRILNTHARRVLGSPARRSRALRAATVRRTRLNRLHASRVRTRRVEWAGDGAAGPALP